MSTDDFAKLNTRRIKYQLNSFFQELTPEILAFCKNMVIYDKNKKKVSLDDIDFNKSCIFVCDYNILPYVSIYALEKINNVLVPDPTPSGEYSRIRTNYVVALSTEIRYSKLDLTSVELEEVPEMYKPTTYLYKKLCIWRWTKDVGQGDNESMYRFCNERLHERLNFNLMDWVFFEGSLSEFNSTYKTFLPIPVYEVLKKGSKPRVITNTSKDDSIKTVNLPSSIG